MRRLVVVCLILPIGACTTPGSQRVEQTSIPGGPEWVSGLLVGRYFGVPAPAAAQADTATGRIRLDARRVDAAGAAAAVLLEQRDAEGRLRRFRMTMRTTSIATRLTGAFEPLDGAGVALGRCVLDYTLRRDGFIARTDAADCRFGEGEDTTVLIKEIAHDGRTLVIGDRVVDPESGRSRGADRVIEFLRIGRFSGWAGVSDGDGAPWRTATAFTVAADASPVRPEDASGMALGIELELAPYRLGARGATVLRLRVFGVDDDRLIGQVWADPGATRIGLAVEGLQIGLELEE